MTNAISNKGQQRMYGLDRFTQLKLRCGFWAAGFALALVAEKSAHAQTGLGLQSSPRAPGAAAAAAANDLEARRLLALDAALIAARGKLFDLSLDAARRATEQPITIARPDFQSSLLGGQSDSSINVYNSRNTPGESPAQVAVRQKLGLLVDAWKEMEAPPAKVAALLQQMVLPDGKGQAVEMYAPRRGASQLRSYDFTMAPGSAALPRVLGLDAVEWAHAAGQLDSFISAMEKRASQSPSQPAVRALLIYAQRMAGRPEAVMKCLESLLAEESKVKGEGNLIIIALTRPLPEPGEAKAIDDSAVADFVMRILNSDPNDEEVRSYALQQLAHAIEQGDRTNAKRYVEAIEGAIDRFDQLEVQYRAQLKTRLSNDAEREALRQGQIELALDFALRQVASGQPRAHNVGWEEDRLTAFAKGNSEQRMDRARRLLLEQPLASPEQLDFAGVLQPSRPPEFFHSQDELAEVLPRLRPFEGANTVSLLDMLLNEAEARGESQQVVDQLFKNASGREDITKLIARWLMLRAEKRGTKLDEKIAALGRFASEEEFVSWVKRLPSAAGGELLSQHIAAGPLTEPVVQLFEQHEPGTLSGSSGTIEGFAEKYYQRRNPSAPPVRSISHLKHWCVSSIPRNAASTKNRVILEVPGPAGKQGLGHQAATLILRYPIAGEVTLQGTFQNLPLQSMALGLHGISLRTGATAYIMFSQRLTDPNRLSLGDSNTLAWKWTKDTLSLSVDGEVKRQWKHAAVGSPFASLSNYSVSGAVPEDLKIVGSIEIPREVALIDRGLTGWNSHWFYHSLPSPSRSFEEIPLSDAPSGTSSSQFAQPSEQVWREDKGEIAVGKRSGDAAAEPASRAQATVYSNGRAPTMFARDGATNTHQTAIYYDRPLLEGERIEFELFHNTKAQTAAPVTGRLAYCLDGDKVRLHWIAWEPELERMDLSEDNRADDPAGEQLAPVKLEDNAWNRLALRIDQGHVVLSIADQDVYRRPLEKDESTHFGFFADPTAPETRIRNVVLKGDWPSELPEDLWELVE